MYAIFRTLNLVLITLLVVTFVQDNFIYIWGGSLVLLSVIPVSMLLSRSFKKYGMELQLLIMLILALFGWQYLDYYEITNGFHWGVLISLLGIDMLIISLQAYIILKPIHPKKDLFDQNIYKKKRIIFQTVWMNLYFFGSLSLFYTYVFGVIIHSSESTYLIKNNIISLVPVGIFWSSIANICIFVLLPRSKNNNQANHINNFDFLKLKKYIYYLFSITFIIGAILEYFTRHEAILFVGTYVYILLVILLVGRAFKMQDRTEEQTVAKSDTASMIDANAMERYVNFFFKFAIPSLVIGFIFTLLFMILLQSFKQ
jgi:hypothetical protein